MSVRRVLFVEDDGLYARATVRGLGSRGWEFELAQSYQAALAALASDRWQILLLDLGLPQADGAQLVRQMRAQGDNRPVLVLTGDEHREVELLDAGADDYVLKPASLGLVEARLRALCRRITSQSGETKTVVDIGRIQIDLVSSRVVFDGSPLELRRGLRKLAVVLAERYPMPSTYDEIRLRVHGGYGNRLLIYREADELRRILRIYGVDVQSERGFGYKLALLGVDSAVAG